MLLHAFNPSTQEVEAEDVSEFLANLVYKVSSKTAGTARKDPVEGGGEGGGG